jgi:hypothetical protein
MVTVVPVSAPLTVGAGPARTGTVGSDVLRNRRPEPERSLTRLRERGTWVHVEPDGRERHGRKEPDLQVAWWWHGGDRTVVLGSGVVVSVLGPSRVERGPLRFLDPAQVVTVGLGSPEPGEVARHRGVGVALDPHVPVMGDDRPAPAPKTPEALAPLLGRRVELRVEGGVLAEHHGLIHRSGTDELPSPAGRLEAAVSDGRNVVVVLDDATVAVVHEPCSVQAGADGGVRLTGDLGRVVLDLPSGEAHAARDAVLAICPLPVAAVDPPTT